MKGRPTKRDQIFIKRRDGIIRQLYDEGIHIADLARMFGVPESVIFKIVNSK